MEGQQPRDGRDLEEIKGRATKSAGWSALGFGGSQVIRLASNLILTRLLVEEFFGLMALVTVVIVGIQLFSDIGINAAMIQNEREDRGFADTMWTIEVIRSTLLWFVALAIARPVAMFYEEPILASLIMVSAFSSVIHGFRSTNYYSENRNLQMKRIIMLDVGATLAGVIVNVVWALVSPTVWSLVAGGLVSSFVSTVWSWVGLPGPRNRFHLEREAAYSLYRFGRWILLSTLLTFLVGNADRIIFGKLVSMSVLGVYNIAINLALVPSSAIAHLSMAVIFPLYSRFQHKGPAMLSVYRSVRLPMLILGGWAASGIIAGGPTIIEILYDPRYIEAGWMLQILVAGLWVGVNLEVSNGVALLALGHSRWMALASGTKLVAMVAFILLGWHLGGFPGAMIGFSAAELPRYLTTMIGVLRFGLDGRMQDLKMTLLVVSSSFVGWLSVQILIASGWTNVFLHAVVIFVVVTAIWAPQHRELLRRYRSTGHIFFTNDPELA